MSSLEPWALGGRPDDETIRRLVVDEHYSDSDLARLYGVARQTGTYYRLKAGLTQPGPGIGRANRRPRLNHKALIPWHVPHAYRGDPIKRRLTELSCVRQGADVSPDAHSRVEEFLDFLKRENVVVTYDPDHLDGDGDPAPFYFVPRDPAIDAEDAIIRP
jgi:hypothetical protein